MAPTSIGKFEQLKLEYVTLSRWLKTTKKSPVLVGADREVVPTNGCRHDIDLQRLWCTKDIEFASKALKGFEKGDPLWMLTSNAPNFIGLQTNMCDTFADMFHPNHSTPQHILAMWWTWKHRWYTIHFLLIDTIVFSLWVDGNKVKSQNSKRLFFWRT